MSERMLDSAVIRELWSTQHGARIPVRRRESALSPNEAAPEPHALSPNEAAPEAHVRAAPSELVLYVELPGVRPPDVLVEWDDAGVLHVTARPAGDDEPTYYRRFDFARAYDAKRARARFALGLLTVTVPSHQTTKAGADPVAPRQWMMEAGRTAESRRPQAVQT